jgi:pimeloyl-ACP methyl ester carboxylesterase
MPAWCTQQGFTARPAFEHQPVSSDTVPVLAISGHYDPFTPPEWADRATANIARRYLVTLPDAGHDSALSGTCPIQIVSAFIADPTSEPSTACVS